jgi:hypothetical protein
MPDIVLDYHRLKTPIDHPDASVTTTKIADLTVTRAKLEYPTVDVSFSYLSAINKTKYSAYLSYSYVVLTKDAFSDKAVWQATQVNTIPMCHGRHQDYRNFYHNHYNPGAATMDHELIKTVGASQTRLGYESIDINNTGRGLAISCSGSTIKGLRYEFTTPIDPLNLPTPNGTISATDTAFSSGLFGFRPLRESNPHGGSESGSAWLKAPLTPLPPAQAVIEVDFEGNGKPDEPYSPSLSKNLIKITSLTGLPDYLYQEAKKYQILINKGLTEDEIKLIFGYIPQHQVDLDAVTWGAFEFHPEKTSSVVVIVTGDNPYRQGAIERLKAKAKRVFKPPKNYSEAVDLYKELVKDYPHWLAGKDNFAYQTLGLEVFDLFQNVDFYHGELIEHKTHYNQLKQVPDWEIENRLNELIDKLSKETVLTDERDKHIAKSKEILKKGW